MVKESLDNIQLAIPQVRLSSIPDQAAVRRRVNELIGNLIPKGRQQDFAELVDIQSSMISRLLVGHVDFSLGQLIKIEAATNARLIWLIHGIEPMFYEEGQAPKRTSDEHFEGVLLRRYLERKNISQAELGRRIGKSTSSVQGYLDSEALSKTNKQIILDALNVTYQEVFGLDSLLGINGHQRQSFTFHPYNLKQKARAILDNIESEIFELATESPEVILKPVTPNTDVQRVARLRLADLRHFESYLSKKEATGEELIKVWLQPDRANVIIPIEDDSIKNSVKRNRSVLAYLTEKGEWPYLKPIIVIEYLNRIETIRIVQNDLFDNENGSLTVSTDEGPTFRIPIQEIKQIWQITRDLGGPLY